MIRKKLLKRITAAYLILVLGITGTASICPMQVLAEERPAETDESETEGSEGLDLAAPSALLMEASTGRIIYEQDADKQLAPASVTKVMTLLLIFEALEEGRISLDDEVTVSEYAASMGGSQVFLEPGETQDVDTMIKCIAVASANDACVAMAEYLEGSETEFVGRMNERAAELGMENTTFKNCNGLDTDGHITTAKDIALMSRELITNHPDIYNYTTIWMDTITHTTQNGTTEFGLTNTNKLISQYEYATGLKTGSTSKALYCVSATARKDDIDLIAVVMAAPDYKVRFEDATAMFQYGFSKCNLYVDENSEPFTDIQISGGIQESAACTYAEEFRYLDIEGKDVSGITKEIKIENNVKAPVQAGETAGKAVYMLDGEEIGSVSIVYEESVGKAGFTDYLIKTVKQICI